MSVIRVLGASSRDPADVDQHGRIRGACVVRLCAIWFLLGLGGPLAASVSAQAVPFKVGERRLTASLESAALRNSDGSAELRVTIWYPAAADSVEERIDIGPSSAPFFLVGAAAPGAEFVDSTRRPIVLLSHGFGGTARMMGWFGTALASHGYVVVSVDHPGNNGADEMTAPGAVLFWERAADLNAALGAVKNHPEIGRHVDSERLVIAGFSAGGITALVASGARVSTSRFVAFCRKHPTDGVCAPQKEFALSMVDFARTLRDHRYRASVTRRRSDHTITGIKGTFVMAPALVQALDPASLKRLRTPVVIVSGAADRIAPPATNGAFAAELLPAAHLQSLEGVGHYDFLSACTAAGRAAVDLCKTSAAAESAHRSTINSALDFLARIIGRP